MPPRNLLDNGKEILSYFQLLLFDAAEPLKKYGLSVDITGYEEMINEFETLRLEDYLKAWDMSQELNAWSDYLSDIRSNCKRVLRDIETDKMSLKAEASELADKTKVANGDRLANKDKTVISIRKERNAVEALCDLLDAKIQFLERAHYMAKKTFEWNQNVSQESKKK